ncbi:hypothetical protein CCR95_03030 [Thiocystis minor]|nr:hypothetical protein [Thiocystis minor]
MEQQVMGLPLTQRRVAVLRDEARVIAGENGLKTHQQLNESRRRDRCQLGQVRRQRRRRLRTRQHTQNGSQTPVMQAQTGVAQRTFDQRVLAVAAQCREARQPIRRRRIGLQRRQPKGRGHRLQGRQALSLLNQAIGQQSALFQAIQQVIQRRARDVRLGRLSARDQIIGQPTGLGQRLQQGARRRTGRAMAQRRLHASGDQPVLTLGEETSARAEAQVEIRIHRDECPEGF